MIEYTKPCAPAQPGNYFGQRQQTEAKTQQSDPKQGMYAYNHYASNSNTGARYVSTDDLPTTRVNAGYQIIDSVQLQYVEYVLGASASAPSKYVTWQYKNGGYAYGHYFSSYLNAMEDMLQRALAEVRFAKELNDRGRVTYRLS